MHRIGDLRTYFIKAVLLCYPTIVQVYERPPTTNDSISYSQSAGVEARRANDHRQYHTLVGLDALSTWHARGAVFGVQQPCCRASRAHDPACVMSLTRLDTRMLCVLVTITESVGNK